MKPMISVAATAGLLDLIAARGGNSDQILQALGTDRSVFSDFDGFIPSFIMIRILEEAALATGDDCFGLHFGEGYNPKNLGPLTYVVLNSPTVLLGIQNAQRYFMIHNGGAKLSLTVEGQRVYLRHRLIDSPMEMQRQHNECSMAVLLNTLRMMVGSQWSPLEVQFAHKAPVKISEHLRIFAAPVVFDCPTNSFVIDPEFLERQVPAADRRLYGILKQYLQRVLNDMPAEDGLLAAVRNGIGESMRNGYPQLANVAKKAAMSPRTLERRLTEHGTSFKQLVNDTRRRFALNYLRDHKNTLTQIAFLLGYSEVSAFNRAFKRWTGSTPLDYRRNPERAVRDRS